MHGLSVRGQHILGVERVNEDELQKVLKQAASGSSSSGTTLAETESPQE